MILISSVNPYASRLKGFSRKSMTSLMFSVLFFVAFSCSSMDYSNLVCSTVLGLRSRSSPVKYLYLSKSLEDKADILAVFLCKSYCPLFLINFYVQDFNLIRNCSFYKIEIFFSKSWRITCW